jgi:hypothetical protein
MSPWVTKKGETMSEKFVSHERREIHPSPERHESADKKFESSHNKHEVSHQKQHEMADTAKHEALRGQETLSKIAEKKAHQPSHDVASRQVKKLTYQRTLKRTQNRLRLPDRTLSRIIHQPAIEKVSEIAAKTIARPSGILGGSILAFVGTLTVLMLTKKYGYEFNYLVFFMMFVGGFAIGALAEITAKTFSKKAD